MPATEVRLSRTQTANATAQKAKETPFPSLKTGRQVEIPTYERHDAILGAILENAGINTKSAEYRDLTSLSGTRTLGAQVDQQLGNLSNRPADQTFLEDLHKNTTLDSALGESPRWTNDTFDRLRTLVLKGAEDGATPQDTAAADAALRIAAEVALDLRNPAFADDEYVARLVSENPDLLEVGLLYVTGKMDLQAAAEAERSENLVRKTSDTLQEQGRVLEAAQALRDLLPLFDDYEDQAQATQIIYDALILGKLSEDDAAKLQSDLTVPDELSKAYNSLESAEWDPTRVYDRAGLIAELFTDHTDEERDRIAGLIRGFEAAQASQIVAEADGKTEDVTMYAQQQQEIFEAVRWLAPIGSEFAREEFGTIERVNETLDLLITEAQQEVTKQALTLVKKTLGEDGVVSSNEVSATLAKLETTYSVSEPASVAARDMLQAIDRETMEQDSETLAGVEERARIVAEGLRAGGYLVRNDEVNQVEQFVNAIVDSERAQAIGIADDQEAETVRQVISSTRRGRQSNETPDAFLN